MINICKNSKKTIKFIPCKVHAWSVIIAKSYIFVPSTNLLNTYLQWICFYNTVCHLYGVCFIPMKRFKTITIPTLQLRFILLIFHLFVWIRIVVVWNPYYITKASYRQMCKVCANLRTKKLILYKKTKLLSTKNNKIITFLNQYAHIVLYFINKHFSLKK